MTKIFLSFLVLAVLMGGFILRLFPFRFNGWADFDSASNALIVAEVASGNFSRMFVHHSPGFYFFWAPFSVLLSLPLSLLFLNALLNMVTIWVLARLLPGLGFSERLFFFLFASTSFFQVGVSRFFSIETLATLFFTLFLWCFHQFFYVSSRTGFLWLSALCLSMALSVNYKLLLVLPFVCVALFFLLSERRLYFLLRWSLLCLCFPVFFMVFAWLTGLPWYRYPAGLVQTLLAYQEVKSRPDPTFYGQFLLYFENILLLPGLLLWGQAKQKTWRGGVFFQDFQSALFFMGFGMFLTFHWIGNAPRALSAFYGLFYLLAWQGFLPIFKHKNRLWPMSLAVLLFCSVFIQIVRLYEHEYRFADTSYPAIAAHLKTKGIKKVGTSANLQVFFFLEQAGIEGICVTNKESLELALGQGTEYFLFDQSFNTSYSQGRFARLAAEEPLAVWAEPSLLPTLLHLENAEYFGLSFCEALQMRNELRSKPSQIWLLKVEK